MRWLIAVLAVGVTTTFAEQGQSAPACQPRLVHCNYAYLYSGDIRIITVDTVSDPDHIVREDMEIRATVSNGAVTCNGERTEHERLGYKGVFNTERRARGNVAGTGLLAVEFEFDNGRPVYKLTLVCPTATITSTTTDLRSGGSETETSPASPADWRDAGLIADPQPSTAVAMTLLAGQQTTQRDDPDNKAGGSTRTTWSLRRS
jgi:hypothetical protein